MDAVTVLDRELFVRELGAIGLAVVLRANRPRKERPAWGSSPPKVE